MVALTIKASRQKVALIASPGGKPRALKEKVTRPVILNKAKRKTTDNHFQNMWFYFDSKSSSAQKVALIASPGGKPRALKEKVARLVILNKAK